MSKIIPLRKLEGSKQSSLQILGLSLLVNKKCILKNVPNISDIHDFLVVFKKIGGKYEYCNSDLIIDSSNICRDEIIINNYRVLSRFRGGIFFLMLIINRCNRLVISYPGGCKIGERSIDAHLDVLRQIGIESTQSDRGIVLLKKKIISINAIRLKEKSMSATVFAYGVKMIIGKNIKILNSAFEPELDDVRKFLLEYEKNDIIEMQIISDRNALVTYFCLMSIVRQKIDLFNFNYHQIRNDKKLLNMLRILNITFCIKGNLIKISYKKKSTSKTKFNFCLKTGRFPLLCTDVHPIIVPALISSGYNNIQIEDDVFDDRFKYLEEICKLNCFSCKKVKSTLYQFDVDRENMKSISFNNKKLFRGQDIRGTVSLILVAVLFGKDNFIITGKKYINRAYENFYELLAWY